jgi:hypothetical protein
MSPLGDGTPFSSAPCCGVAYAAARPPARPPTSAWLQRIRCRHEVCKRGSQVMCPLYLCTGFEPTAWLLFFEFVIDMV